MTRIFFFLVAVCLLPTIAYAQQEIFSTDFNSLVLGETQDPPLSGQDGWRSVFHPGNSFGEIQDTVASCGNAIHQFTDISNTSGQQSIDARSFSSVDLSTVGEIIFEIDFYASSSDLSTLNSYAASAILDGDGQLFGFSVGSGNGQVKSEAGVSVGISTFNGTDNNFGVNLDVGQNLAWDTWHSV